MDGQYWKGDRTMSTNEWLLTSDFWQFLEPWHGRWYEYEIFIASLTDNIYDLENERWLLGDMIDHVGIYGSRVAEGLSAFNVGLVNDAIVRAKYPTLLKVAKVIALFKKGERHNPHNYRPISLLSSFSKIFEKIIAKRLIAF